MLRPPLIWRDYQFINSALYAQPASTLLFGEAGSILTILWQSSGHTHCSLPLS